MTQSHKSTLHFDPGVTIQRGIMIHLHILCPWKCDSRRCQNSTARSKFNTWGEKNQLNIKHGSVFNWVQILSYTGYLSFVRSDLLRQLTPSTKYFTLKTVWIINDTNESFFYKFFYRFIYISSVRGNATQEGVKIQQRAQNSTLEVKKINWILNMGRYSIGVKFYLTPGIWVLCEVIYFDSEHQARNILL